MNALFQYISTVFKGVGTLLTGMKVTGKYFFTPWKNITQQYPENRETLKMFDRFRGEVIMPHNENNEHLCTGCGICELNCPNGSIEIISKMEMTEEGKKKEGNRPAHLPSWDVHALQSLCKGLPYRSHCDGSGI